MATARRALPPEFHEIPGYLLRRALQAHNLLWTGGVAGDLTPQQYAVLVALARGTDLDQRGVGDLVSLDKSNVADVVHRLQGRGLVERHRDPEDGRRWVLELTAAGRRLVHEATPAVLEVNESLLGPLSAKERTDLVRLLAKVAYGSPAA